MLGSNPTRSVSDNLASGVRANPITPPLINHFRTIAIRRERRTRMNRSKKNAKKNRKKNGNRFEQRDSKHWSRYLMTVGAMGALLTYAPGVALAESPRAARLAPRVLEAIYGAVQTQQTQRFDIPPGPLETVLDAFQKLTELQALVPNEKLRTIPSPGVSGMYTVERALAQILAGTGVTYRFSGPKIITLELEGVAASVEILGRIT